MNTDITYSKSSVNINQEIDCNANTSKPNKVFSYWNSDIMFEIIDNRKSLPHVYDRALLAHLGDIKNLFGYIYGCGNVCYASNEFLCAICHITEKTLRKYRNYLLDKNLITYKKGKCQGSAGEYQINTKEMIWLLCEGNIILTQMRNHEKTTSGYKTRKDKSNVNAVTPGNKPLVDDAATEGIKPLVDDDINHIDAVTPGNKPLVTPGNKPLVPREISPTKLEYINIKSLKGKTEDRISESKHRGVNDCFFSIG